MQQRPQHVKGEPLNLRVTALSHGEAPRQVLQQLREAIVSGDAPAGAKLPSEPTLATTFRVSKSVIREAIKVLSAQGFVTVKQGSGTTVNDQSNWNVIDPEVLLATRRETTLADLIEARRLHEPELARLAASRADTAAKARIAEMLIDHRLPVEQHVQIDVEFHRRVADAAGNPILLILLDSIGILLQEHRRALYEIPGSVERALSFHSRIYEAIATNDPQAAARAMHAHLDQVATDLAELQQLS
jgi:DNA-binding FadR family transcriptional regulator